MLVVTVFVVENIMTCRVHRAVVLGLITNGERNTTAFSLTTVGDILGATPTNDRGRDSLDSRHSTRIGISKRPDTAESSSSEGTLAMEGAVQKGTVKDPSQLC